MLIEALIISILIFFQSIFGVGLLLFGTPTFLLLNYNFLDTLYILFSFPSYKLYRCSKY